jgi:hypothetical protein
MQMWGAIRQYFRSCWFEVCHVIDDLIDWDFSEFGFKHSCWQLWRDFIHPIRCIKYGIENLVAWFPMIWTDRDWDHNYASHMLVFKLKRMVKLFKKYGHHTEVDRDVKRIQFVIDCFERIHKDEYREKMKAEHKEKYGTLEHNSIPHATDSNGKILTYRMDFYYSKCETTEDYETASELYHKIHTLEEADTNRDYRLAFKVMEKYWRTWWD